MGIIIKKLTADAKLLSDVQKFLFGQIKTEFGFGYVPQWHQDIINLNQYYITPKRNNFFVAFDDKTNEIVATIGVRSYDKDFKMFKGKYDGEKTASIWRLFVDKKYRRCGLASKMFALAENFANESDFKNIYLHTHKTLPGAIEFWTKMGFVVSLDEDNDLQTVHMDKMICSIDLDSIASSFDYAVEF